MCASLSPTKVRIGPFAPLGPIVVANLAGAALDLVEVVAVAIGEWRKLAAELDHIAISIIPIVEQREVVDDGIDRGGYLGVTHSLYIGEQTGRDHQ
jgi:hypothetical protein